MLTDDPSQIVEGNVRVVRPRLADAQFFFEQDKNAVWTRWSANCKAWFTTTSSARKGARVARVQAIAAYLAEQLGANVADAKRAAYIAKADLVSDMVGEFPELQKA